MLFGVIRRACTGRALTADGDGDDGGDDAGAFPPLLLDVCCGGGAIGISVALAARAAGVRTRVVGIELSGASVADAVANAAACGLGEDEFFVRQARRMAMVLAVGGMAMGWRWHGRLLMAAAWTWRSRADAVTSRSQRLSRVWQARAEAAIESVLAEEDRRRAGQGGGEGGVAVDGAGGAVAVVDPPRTGMAPAVLRALRAAAAVRHAAATRPPLPACDRRVIACAAAVRPPCHCLRDRRATAA